jgi:DNA-binding LytR/AlgR family response regulator
MIRYILVDDNPKTLISVKKKIDEIADIYNLKHIDSFDNPIAVFEEINEIDYDLLIVDFEMPNCNGIELALKIAKNKKIIFLTSTTNNEKEIINKLDISGYLSKPFEIDEFKEILINKILGQIYPRNNFETNNSITINVGSNRDVIFNPDTVYYISTAKFNNQLPSKNCVNIYGKNDELLHKNVRISIKELYEKLVKFKFERMSKSTLINLKHLKERDNMHVCLINTKQTFEVTNTQKPNLINAIRNIFRY